MGCFSALCRAFIIFVNIIFLIIGLALFAGGLFLRFGDKYIDPLVSAAELAIEATVKSVYSTDININVDFGALFLGLSLTFIFAGLGFIAISITGCCGSCYKIKCLLIIYVLLCSILLIGEVIVVALVYRSPNTIQNPIKTTLKKTIQSDFAGLQGTDIVSVAWNVVMQKLHCCGVDSYADFTGATKWETAVTTGSGSYTLVTPISCCKTLPTSTDLTCATSTASATNNAATGCFDEVWKLTLRNKVYAYSILASIGAFQFFLIVAAIVLLCAQKNEKKNKTHPETPQANSWKKPSKWATANPPPYSGRY